MSHLTVTD
ncbi:hypothetical protein E2C01_096199 [Portunus trituberculatus]|uniref:Uncharacterized protein n=1 Tax=Portunus trituberculatus TaxID=210409 RepID=A0A5B7K1F3_PORTR|nr:hypothetical protein [Portunus trituberculatus]